MPIRSVNPKPRDVLRLAIAFAFVSILIFATSIRGWKRVYRISSVSAAKIAPRELAANSTLGFQKIYALTQGTSWRLQGLYAAAEFTGLAIEAPRQVPISDQVVQAFRSTDAAQNPLYGAALAWIAHLKLLELVMQTNITSALILEDDVDWDVALLEQMLTISDGVRNFTSVPADDPNPYGSHWDVLWLGHCGEPTAPSIPYLAWPDETVVPHELYAGWASHYIMGLPEAYRTINPTTSTVCSFAYAVSRAGTPKILNALNHGGDEAFDIALNAACRAESDLRCFTINPEIMHHYVPSDGPSSEVKSGNREAEVAATDLDKHKGTTNNLRNSVRCHVLWNSPCIGNTWT